MLSRLEQIHEGRERGTVKKVKKKKHLALDVSKASLVVPPLSLSLPHSLFVTNLLSLFHLLSLRPPISQPSRCRRKMKKGDGGRKELTGDERKGTGGANMETCHWTLFC